MEKIKTKLQILGTKCELMISLAAKGDTVTCKLLIPSVSSLQRPHN
uniref:Uncharacterized protein n=1 Tax=Nelumbo nucifera TaxID=4432 RepID=A0A822YW69_NELNU|nr:TPA_asm: hypothetical protein HUJ06_007428 [Nelumbo nucifera]